MRLSSRVPTRGFTLIELMVVVVIAGILAAVAYPAFTSFMQRSRRADAMAVLTTVVQAQERYRSNHSAYTSDLSTDGLSVSVASISKYYTVSIVGVGPASSLATGYIASAQAKQDGPQALDLKCASMIVKLESTVFSYLSADSAGTDTTNDGGARCWIR